VVVAVVVLATKLCSFTWLAISAPANTFLKQGGFSQRKLAFVINKNKTWHWSMKGAQQPALIPVSALIPAQSLSLLWTPVLISSHGRAPRDRAKQRTSAMRCAAKRSVVSPYLALHVGHRRLKSAHVMWISQRVQSTSSNLKTLKYVNCWITTHFHIRMRQRDTPALLCQGFASCQVTEISLG